MKSLLFSLNALNAQIVAQLPIYKSDVEIGENLIILSEDIIALLEGATGLL
jgi:hypothetical protein